MESRSLCVLREALAAHDALADFAFAMQGLGSGAITLGGTDALRGTWLPRVARGEAIAAFALSEPDAGSDAAALQTRAVRTPGGWQVDGTKTWISNGGIADFYCVFARTTPGAPAAKGISPFFVAADTPRLVVHERIAVMSPHRWRPSFDGCVVPDECSGRRGRGLALAMHTLDIFASPSRQPPASRDACRTPTPPAARCSARPSPSNRWRAIIGDMATDVDAPRSSPTARPAARHAARADDRRGDKPSATELGQRVIDQALQLHGRAAFAWVRSSSVCTATSAPFASTKAPPRSSACWSGGRCSRPAHRAEERHDDATPPQRPRGRFHAQLPPFEQWPVLRLRSLRRAAAGECNRRLLDRAIAEGGGAWPGDTERRRRRDETTYAELSAQVDARRTCSWARWGWCRGIGAPPRL